MTREERIARYEEILERANRIVGELEAALDAYESVQADLAALEAYYTGPEWREDFEADEAGLLPRDLKRGVLSEDGIADALDWMKELAERLRAYAAPAEDVPEEPLPDGCGEEDPLPDKQEEKDPPSDECG